MQRKNFRSLGLALLGVALLGTAACEDDVIFPREQLIVTAAPSAIEIQVGEIAQVVANLSGGILGGANTLTYQSSNPSVATVDANGTVRGVSAGSATITVTGTRTLGGDVETVRTAVGVRVTARPVAPTEAVRLNLSPDNASVPVGSTATFVANVERDNAPAGSTVTVSFRLSDTTTATIVSQSGNVVTVRGRNAGTVSVIATATSSSGATITTQDASQLTVTQVPGQQFTVAPEQASLPQLAVNQTLRLAASEAATFVSLDTTIVTVDSLGTVTARRAGTATVQIRSTRTGQVVSRTFTVTALAPNNAFVNIVSVSELDVANQGTPGIQGQVQVTLQVVPGTADSLRVLIGSRVAEGCSRNFIGTTVRELSITCTVNTAAFDTVTGQPLFPNAATRIVAQLIDDGNLIAQSSEQNLSLANVNQFALSVTTTGPSAFDPQGVLWRSGDVRVVVRPVFFTGAVGQVAVEFGGNVVQATAQGNGTLLAVFPNDPRAAGSVAGQTITDNVTILSATTAAGDPIDAPVFNTDAFVRLDNQAPAGGALADQLTGSGFVNANFPFAASARNASVFVPTANTDSDSRDGTFADFGGVDRVRVVFFFGPSNLTSAQVLARNDSVTSSAGLAATQTNQALRLVARVCDALNNCRTVSTTAAGGALLFGVDPLPPVITSFGIPNRFIANSPADTTVVFTVTAIDTGGGAGIDLNDVLRVQIIRRVPGGTVCASGTTSSGACAFMATGNTIEVPNAFGYYTINFFARDRAGNVTATTTRELLVDLEAPRVINVNFPASFQAGAQTTFAADIADNLDLFNYQARLFFPVPGGTSVALPFNNQQVISLPFDDDLVTGRNVTSTVPLIVSLTFEAGVTPAGGRATTDLFAAGFEVFDAARNVGSGERTISGFNTTTDPFASFTFTSTVSPTTVCNNSSCGSTARSATLSATLQGAQGVTSPFRTVYFYRAVGATAELVGIAQTASIVDRTVGNNAVREFTFSTSVDAANLPDGSVTLYAVGVNGSGNGFHSTNSTLTVQ